MEKISVSISGLCTDLLFYSILLIIIFKTKSDMPSMFFYFIMVGLVVDFIFALQGTIRGNDLKVFLKTIKQ